MVFVQVGVVFGSAYGALLSYGGSVDVHGERRDRIVGSQVVVAVGLLGGAHLVLDFERV